MHRNTPSSASAKATSAFLSLTTRSRPLSSRPTSSANCAGSEVRRLQLELAQVKQELHNLKLATQHFVRALV
jgi:hypothetical protein